MLHDPPDGLYNEAKSDNAATCEKCAGCKHRNHGEAGAWCYMFQDSPEELPCSQHDKFEPLRKAMGKNTRALAFITGSFGSG